MAVDDRRRQEDLYDVSLRPHDERVELKGWTYYIRAVKRDYEFTTSRLFFTNVWLVDVPRLLLRGVQWTLERHNPWIVGVVRLGSVASWNDLRPRILYREKLADGEQPTTRIDEMRHRVLDGDFSPPE